MDRTLWHVVAYLAVVRMDNRLLMGLRSSGVQRGTWCVPGGHLEPGETPAECAARELLEETGVSVAGRLSPLDSFTSDRGGVGYVHMPFVRLFTPDGGDAAPGDGLSEVRWVGRHEVGEMTLHTPTRRILSGLGWVAESGS